MTFQNKDMGGFRELALDEIQAVSGGADTIEDIVVIGYVDGGPGEGFLANNELRVLAA